jgi:hypothetical protein
VVCPIPALTVRRFPMHQKMVFSVALGTVLAVVCATAFLIDGPSRAAAAFTGTCEGTHNDQVKVCENVTDCLPNADGTTCNINPFVCPDGSCGPNQQECSRAINTASVKYGYCAVGLYVQTCAWCDTYWCGSFTSYTGYDPTTQTCLNKKCNTIWGKSNACIPAGT